MVYQPTWGIFGLCFMLVKFGIFIFEAMSHCAETKHSRELFRHTKL